MPRPLVVAAAIALSIMLALTAGSTLASEPVPGELPQLFPASREGLTMGPVDGQPPVAEVRRAGVLIGYAFSTHSVSGSLGFGGRPIDIHVGLTLDGHIAGARLVAHEEPILVIGVSPQALEAFVASLAGADIHQSIARHAQSLRNRGLPDHVAGATVSSTVIKDAVLRSARAVALSRIAQPARAARSVDRTTFHEADWAALAGTGAIASLTLTRQQLGLAPADAQVAVRLHAALLTPPAIGQNLLGRRDYEALAARLDADESAIMLAGAGLYSFKGTQWRQDGVFDRIQLVQGSRTIKLKSAWHEAVERLAIAGSPDLREIAIFRLPRETGFDPAQPWRIDLAVDGLGQSDGTPRVFSLRYALPAAYLSPASTASPPATQVPAVSRTVDEPPEVWVEIWRGKPVEIAMTVLMLAVLTAILFSHDLLTRNVRLYRATRLAFLVTTLVFLGAYAGAQLSIVHVVTFVHAVLGGFKWDQFLLDPLTFILWSFVAVALLFWGRGVFCGWLCPFGALQELVSEAARRLGVRQIVLPWALHERLWPIKYVAFLAILAISFRSVTHAYQLAEIEPFKTAVALKFVRAWPFVLYVIVLLAAGLFIERFYCRYLCPLGAALAIPARLRLFEWLKRRPQCGRECRICAATCTVQAINPLGAITPNECIYCLKCQANYYDATTCLPLKQRAMRHASRQGRPSTEPRQ